MYWNFCITILSLLCNLANCEFCKPLEDPPNKITEEFIESVSEDAQNITNNIDDFVTNLRKILKTKYLPEGIVEYYLYTPETVKNPYFLTANCYLQNVPYDNRKPLAFVVHGYSPNINMTSGITGDLAQAVVGLNKYNVIFVKYTKLVKNVLSIVVPRAFLAAKEMSEFLLRLMDKTGTKREQIHVIGISLGGQISGMIGHFLPGIGRISGLDPGGAFFALFPKDLRLDRSDAIFVDVMHTGDASPLPKGWGIYKPCGHLDFYVNGGLFQPGCGSTVPVEQYPQTVDESAARLCMHNRMYLYYIESTCSTCTFVGTLCENYEKYQQGMCNAENSRTAVMGEFATQPLIDLPEDSMFFLNTNDKYPFCKLQQPTKSTTSDNWWSSIFKIFSNK